MNARRMRSGLSRVDTVTILAAILVFLLTMALVIPLHRVARFKAAQVTCRANLARIGKAIGVYVGDYDEVLPVAGGPGTVWGPGLRDWKAGSRADAFGLDPNGAGGQATVSASLCLLVKYAGLRPEMFICRPKRGIRVFLPERYGIDANGLADLWDFGPDPARHCSYAYHLPYGPYRMTTSSEPGMPVVADRNPWIDGPRQKAATFSTFKPDIPPFGGTMGEGRQGNSRAHQTRQRSDGQNVLYLDGHVEFAQRAYCGIEEDNAYTSWDGRDRARGMPPKLYESQPAHQLDSLLVNDPPLGR